MRCPDCSKFVSMEFAEPEVESIEVDDAGNVTISVHLERSCAECGTQLKEASLDIEWTAEGDDAKLLINHAKDHPDHLDLSIEEDSVEGIEEGGGRYSKSYFGAGIDFTIRCNDEKCDFKISGSASDKIAASSMDECV